MPEGMITSDELQDEDQLQYLARLFAVQTIGRSNDTTGYMIARGDHFEDCDKSVDQIEKDMERMKKTVKDASIPEPHRSRFAREAAQHYVRIQGGRPESFKEYFADLLEPAQ